MRDFDVFNGDADGICALHQLRLAEPRDAELVTGLKHDIALLERVQAAAGDRVTVLDLSMERNRAALIALLARGASVAWFDHHYAGTVPDHPGLRAVLDPSGRTCTSELVDRHLGGRSRAWAVVGAFGDNFPEAAARLAPGLGLDAAALERLRELGEALNYNAYGADASDVLVQPLAMYRMVSRYADPFALFEGEPAIAQLVRERRADLERAATVAALSATQSSEVHVLPDAPWSRRVMGCYANRLALDRPHRAHAVLAPLPGGGYGVSVRSPAAALPAAVDFCRRFPGGGGRMCAAGIERLPAARLDEFVAAFGAAYGHGAAGT
jgi:hypothetical protein